MALPRTAVAAGFSSIGRPYQSDLGFSATLCAQLVDWKPAGEDVEGARWATVVEAQDPSSLPGKLKSLGGSKSDTWNNIIANQTIKTLWLNNSDEESRKTQINAAIAGLIGINPNDELEGMLAAQLVACHNASMECHRRSMIGEQTFEGRRENLNQANKLSRTYATLLEALNRHRGKGQQKVTVEHVHVHEGAQAIVGNVERRDSD